VDVFAYTFVRLYMEAAMKTSVKYDSLSDSEIICRIQNGDKPAIDYLLEKYKYLVRNKAKALFLIGGDKDD
jgi:RNA polymerase sporulation-specific sigma factor